MKLFRRMFKNQRGFTLPEVMIAAGIMGGIAVALTFLIKQQANQSIRSNQDAALATAKAEIIAILTNPANCNANLANAPLSVDNNVTTDVTSIFQCNGKSGNTKCANTTPGPEDYTEKFKATAATASSDDWKSTGILDQRLKITKIERNIAPVTVDQTCPVAYRPCLGLTTATYHITFTRRNIITDAAGTTQQVPQNILPKFVVPVVVATTYDGVDSTKRKVAGCPKSWSSTELY